MDTTTTVGILTLLGTILTSYVSWRMGRMAADQKRSEVANTEEAEFQKSLLELIEQQEQKISRQDTKIERLETFVDTQKALSDEFRRANLNLTIENQRLRARVSELEIAEKRLRVDLEKLKDG